MPGMKTRDGIFIGGGAKAAWFKDSEGNILAVIQELYSGSGAQLGKRVVHLTPNYAGRRTSVRCFFQYGLLSASLRTLLPEDGAWTNLPSPR